MDSCKKNCGIEFLNYIWLDCWNIIAKLKTCHCDTIYCIINFEIWMKIINHEIRSNTELGKFTHFIRIIIYQSCKVCYDINKLHEKYWEKISCASIVRST